MDCKTFFFVNQRRAPHINRALANGVRISIWFLRITDKYIFNIVKWNSDHATAGSQSAALTLTLEIMHRGVDSPFGCGSSVL